MQEYSQQIRDSIVEYLKREFPLFEITEEKNKDSYCFRLKDNSSSYFLRVMFSAILIDDYQHTIDMLEQYAVSNTMRGLGDFPVVVTEQGCMFGSP